MRRNIIVICILMVFLCGCKNSNIQEETVIEIPEISVNEQQIKEFKQRVQSGNANRYEGLQISSEPVLTPPNNLPDTLFYNSGIHIQYPETGVRGIYVPINVLSDKEQFLKIVEFINNTELNTIVIDIKDDHGNITTTFQTNNQEIIDNSSNMIDINYIMSVLEENQIYPIARIVAFKDTIQAEKDDNLSFTNKENGELWTDANGSKFINPFIKLNQDYIINIAIEASKIGFKDIQLDYVRFPEGFETFHDELNYSVEEFNIYNNSGEERTAVIADFISKMKTSLMPYNTKLSADIFGYITIVKNTEDVTGIGQDFYKIAENVDVISAMIYPSHWSIGFFGIDFPNAKPYETIYEYVLSEKQAFTQLSKIPVSRPWLQDFTDYDKTGENFIVYTSKEVQDQINALYENDIKEYLLWNAEGIYSEYVDYYPDY